MKKKTKRRKKKKSAKKETSKAMKRQRADAAVKPQERKPAEAKEKLARIVPKRAVDVKAVDRSSILRKGIRFLGEAKTEMKKVKWPTRKELLASTAVVIVLTLIVAFFLGLVDFGLVKIIKNIVG